MFTVQMKQFLMHTVKCVRDMVILANMYLDLDSSFYHI